MNGDSQSIPERSPRDSSLLPTFLQAVGFIDLIATPVGVLIVLALRVYNNQPVDSLFASLLIGAFLVGLTFGALLIGLAAMLRSVAGDQGPATDEVAIPYYTDTGLINAHTDDSAGMTRIEAQRLMTTLADLRDVHLLPEEDRAQSTARLRAQAEHRATEEIVDAINRRQLGRARVLLRGAKAVYGDTVKFEKLADRIDTASKRNEALDYARTKRLVEDAIREHRWSDAEPYAHTLYMDHPESARSKQLWEDTRRARLYTHIQECSQRHHWAEALAATEEFLGRFPIGREAEALRAQKATLASNAEIVQRKHYEERFKEFLGAQQFADALRIAKHVIEHFPRSPQAAALRDQIPALEQRAAGQSA